MLAQNILTVFILLPKIWVHNSNHGNYNQHPATKPTKSGAWHILPTNTLYTVTDNSLKLMNDTLIKFGYPDSAIKTYEHWSVLLRPEQVTLGSLILASHSNAYAFGDLSDLAMKELSTITKDIEASLTDCFSYDKINYLMLMMVDPHVHFHVIPRYSASRGFLTIKTTDEFWPGPPDLSHKISLDLSQKQSLLEHLKTQWISH